MKNFKQLITSLAISSDKNYNLSFKNGQTVDLSGKDARDFIQFLIMNNYDSKNFNSPQELWNHIEKSSNNSPFLHHYRKLLLGK